MQFMCDHGHSIVLVTNLHIVIVSYIMQLDMYIVTGVSFTCQPD